MEDDLDEKENEEWKSFLLWDHRGRDEKSL